MSIDPPGDGEGDIAGDGGAFRAAARSLSKRGVPSPVTGSQPRVVFHPYCERKRGMRHVSGEMECSTRTAKESSGVAVSPVCNSVSE